VVELYVGTEDPWRARGGSNPSRLQKNMTFQEAVGYIFILEGIQSDDARDPGGLTKWGIAKASHPEINFDVFTKRYAREIYRHDYWNRMHIEDLPDILRLAVFDCGVNQGPGTSVKFLQTILGVEADGAIGSETLKALDKADLGSVLTKFQERRVIAYTSTPGVETYGKGWLSRVTQISKWSEHLV
jgi:lysozyme family protein